MKILAATCLYLLAVVLASSAAAAPTGYSINSDSPTDNADSLYRIDLGTGAESRIGTVHSLGDPRIDVEGLAFAPDGTLYGVDDSAMTLFPLDPESGAVRAAEEVFIKDLPSGGANDFGMSFACDGNLYVSSIATGSLYRMDLNGNTSVVGSAGSLNPVRISAIAAWGNPATLYGLGSGADADGKLETPYLYEIDLANGTAKQVGPLGPAAGPYLQGGLSFDDDGQLWAITEGAAFGWPSQIMKIDRGSGAASAVRTLSEQGYESLAIAAPGGCVQTPPPPVEPPPTEPPPPPPPQAVGSVIGVPTLGPLGLLLAAIALLLTGLTAIRRP
jgi:hypothetical protein